MAIQLGLKIKTERKKLGFTLDQLAELTESSKSYIWELENKDGVNPSGEKLSKLAEALKVPVEFLLSDKEELTELDAKKVFFRRFAKLEQKDKATLEALLEALERGSKS